MFGILRLFLALLVAESHFGLIFWGFNPGQWSVVGFYILSGYLMSKQAAKLCANGKLLPFYADRFLRIYPLYFTLLLLMAPYFVGSLWQFLQNVLLIPLNYTTFTGTPIAIGPTWSLACEVQFYLLVPFLAKVSTVSLRKIAVTSLGIFTVSPLLPYSTFWGYTGLAGVLFLFVAGMLLDRREIKFLNGIQIYGSCLLAVFLLLKYFKLDLPTGIHINVLIGLTLFLPLVMILAGFKPKSKTDQYLGLLSYPLFLCHEPVHVYASKFLGRPFPGELLLLSLLCAGLLLAIELPFDSLRYRIRRLIASKE